MVISIKAHGISEFLGDRSNRKLFERMDGERNYLTFVNKLVGYGMSGGRIAIAMDEDVLAGCYGYNAVTPTSGCYSEDFLAEVGPDAVLSFAHNIWVRPEYRGTGLSQDLRSAYTKDAKAHGFTHGVGFMPQTDTIDKWAKSLTDVRVLTAKDKNGGWITIRSFV